MRSALRYFRLIYRLPVFAAVLLWHAATFAAFPANRQTLKGRALWLNRVSRAVLNSIGVKLTFSGQPPVLGVIAANHLSYLDIVVLSALSPTVFVAKSEVRDWPIFGWFARMSGTLFINRGRRNDVVRVGDQIPLTVTEGVCIVVFLEGTSTDGREVLPFRSSLLGSIARLDVALTPVALAYSVPPGRRVDTEICWWGDMTLTPHLLNLLTLGWIQARVSFGTAIRNITDRKHLAALTRERVLDLHGTLNKAPAHQPPPNLAG